MTTFSVRRRRTGWDIAAGIAMILLAAFLLADTVVATLVSVLVLGWVATVAGVVALVAAVVRLRTGPFWSTAISGVLLTVLGLMIVRHPEAAAVTLTLIAGAVFLASGLLRLAAVPRLQEGRVATGISGAASVVLGLIVLFDIVPASLTLLGWLLGLQVLFDGISLLLAGRAQTDTAQFESTDGVESAAILDASRP